MTDCNIRKNRGKGGKMTRADLTGLEKPKVIPRDFRRRYRHLDNRILMISTIDFAFLLFIFFRVCAYYDPRPGCLGISLPTRYEKLNPKPIPEAKLLRLFVDEYDSFYYQIEKFMDQPVEADFESLVMVISAISREVDDPVMLLKLDPRASYNSMVKIIGKIKSIEREINKQKGIESQAGQIAFRRYQYSQIILREMSTVDKMLLAQITKERRN